MPEAWLNNALWQISKSGDQRIKRKELLQSLWKGYGQILRLHLEGGPISSLILKQIHPPTLADNSLAHQRKLRSYQIERAWYRQYSQKCDHACRVPHFFAQGTANTGDWLLLEDLDAAGYPKRKQRLNREEMTAVLSWLAHFHARFLGQLAPELWEEGSYWHLDTRPDEWQALQEGPLKAGAATISAKLKNCKFQTLIHGDAKPANFCFSASTPDGIQVAAVDFQYIGRGCGMKDLAYFLSACFPETQVVEAIPGYLNLYFTCLRQALDNPNLAMAVETEWRSLFNWAWVDFYRFELGWLGGNSRNYPYSEQILKSIQI